MYFTQTKLRVHYLHYIKYDNPNKCNKAAHCCVYSAEYQGQKVMTLPFTFTHHYIGTAEGEYSQKIHSFDKSSKWTTTYCFNTPNYKTVPENEK